MGCVAVLNPHDLLKDRFNYSPMPLISPSPPTKDSFKSVSNSNRRKKSPQKKTHENPKVFLSPQNSNSGKKTSAPAKSSHGPNLVMGKVTILKRGEALEKKTAKEEKPELSVKENRSEKIVLSDKENKSVKKAELSVKEKNSEKIVRVLSDKENKQKNVVKVDNKNVGEKNDVVRENEDKSTQKVLRSFGPEPCMLPRCYAGSACVDSPSPRSLPLPGFLAAKANFDYATNILRGVLKLGVGL